MGQLRTANKRHKRAIAANLARKAAVEKDLDAAVSPEDQA
jgi:hypothetical protein